MHAVARSRAAGIDRACGHAATFASFAGAGAVATAVQYLVYVSLVEGAVLDAVRASAGGFGTGAALSHARGAALVLPGARRPRQGAGRFATVAGIRLGLDSALVPTLAEDA
jgi:hypothetical protein